MKKKTKENVEESLGAVKKIAVEFEKFISRGSVVDLAVGVIIGAAFGKIVSSLVNDILMPLVGLAMGGLDFSGLAIQVGAARITYGNFIQNIIDFLFIALGVFIFVKIVNGLNSRATKTESQDKVAAKTGDEQLAVLREIRDELKK